MSTRHTLRTLAAIVSLGAAFGSPPTVRASVTAPSHRLSGRTEVPTDFGSVDDAGPLEHVRPSRVEGFAAAASGTRLVEVTGDSNPVATALRSVGADVRTSIGNLTLAYVPAGSVDRLSRSIGVVSVRAAAPVNRNLVDPALRTERGPVTGQPTALASQWHQRGYTGAGSKVGIIGLFDSTVLANEIASGELPNVPAGNRICVSAGVTCTFGTPGATFGNSLAEIEADMAPSASLYLAEIGYRTDYVPIIDWMAANGVTILVNPLVWPYDGPGDGTGPSAAIVDYAVGKGIAWFNTAGEMSPGRGGVYWRGTWNDPDNDRLLNWYGSDESNTVYCGFLLGLRWNDWGRPLTDYDLLISDYRANNRTYGTRKVLSANSQAVAGAQPLEGTSGVSLCNQNPARGPVYDANGDGFVSLWVQRSARTSNSPAGDVLELGTYYGWLERYTNGEYSASHPFADSRSTGMLTVGHDIFGSGDLQSGWGPTTDGRIKPDMFSRGCVATSVDGAIGDDYCINAGYYGSDAATAIVAGLAALTAPAMGAIGPVQVTRYLRDNGSENGQAHEIIERTSLHPVYAALPEPPPLTYPPSLLSIASPVRLLDTRGAPSGPIGTYRAQRIKAGETFHLKVWGGTVAVVLNVGMVRASGRGYLSVQLMGWSVPAATSAVNTEVAGQTRANTVVVPVGSRGYIDIYSSVETDLIVDVLGGFSSGYGGGQLQPTTPTRIADTRSCLGLVSCTGSPIPAGTFTTVDVGAFEDAQEPWASVPDSASAAMVAVSVDTPLASGYLSVLPSDVLTATTSNLNFDAQRGATTMAVVRLDEGANGRIKLYSNATTHYQVDLLGWFTGPTNAPYDTSGSYVPLKPSRLFDSRIPAGSQPLSSNTVTSVAAATAGVPADAAAVLMNNTAVNPLTAGEVQVAATPQTIPPTFRNLSAGAAGMTLATSTLARVSAGSYTMRNTMPTHLITDLWGYFTGPVAPRAAVGSTVPINLPVTYGHECCANALLSDDGSTVALTGLALTPLRIWHRSTNSLLTSIDAGRQVTAVAISPDGAEVGAWARSSDTYVMRAFVVDSATGADVAVSVDNSGNPVEVVHRPSFSADLSIVLFDTHAAIDPNDTVPNSLDWYARNRTSGITTWLPNAPNGARLTPDGSHLVAVSEGSLKVYDIATTTTTTIPIAGGVLSAAFNSTMAVVAQISSAEQIYVFKMVDLATGQITDVPAPQGGPWHNTGYLTGLELSADGLHFGVTVTIGHVVVSVADGTVVPFVLTASGFLPNGALNGVLSSNFQYALFATWADNVVLGQPPDQHVYIQARSD